MEYGILGLIIMIISSVVIAKASNVFEVATDYLGRKMKDGVKGLTLNAIGSSFPELLTTVFFLGFATQENLGRDLAASIGGNAGSAIFNSIVIPMLVIFVVLLQGVKTFNVSKKVVLRDGIFLIVAELLLLVILSSNKITQVHGWILTSFYLIYLIYALLNMQKGGAHAEPEFMKNPKKNWYTNYLLKFQSGRTWRSWNLLIFAILFIGAASAGLVEGCKMIADSLHINPLFIALVLVAAATSVPDTIISMKDARKGNHNDALSNVLGSNIFDITISIGLPLAIYLLVTGESINFESEGQTLIDIRIMLLIVTALTILVYLFSKKISTMQVFMFFILYALFIVYAIGAAKYNSGAHGWLADFTGKFINWLGKPGGINDFLQHLSNALSKGWR